MERQNEGIEIDLISLFYYLRKRIIIIVAAALVATALGFVISTFFITPQYTAETRLYVLNRSDETNMSASSFQIANYMLNDYKVLITGRNVTAKVIEQLNLDMSSSGLEKRIRVTAPEDTRVLQISVTDEDPQRAADIANVVREVASEQIQDIMDVDAVKLVYEAGVPAAPSSPNVMRNTFLSMLLGAVIAVAVLVVIYTVDDTITKEEDVTRHLGLSVLAVIPESEDMRLGFDNVAGSGKRNGKTGRK